MTLAGLLLLIAAVHDAPIIATAGGIGPQVFDSLHREIVHDIDDERGLEATHIRTPQPPNSE
jgi:hypothetical protein